MIVVIESQVEDVSMSGPQYDGRRLPFHRLGVIHVLNLFIKSCTLRVEGRSFVFGSCACRLGRREEVQGTSKGKTSVREL